MVVVPGRVPAVTVTEICPLAFVFALAGATEATPEALEVMVHARPASGWAAAPVTVTVSVVVARGTSVADDGAMVTLATGASIRTVAAPTALPLLAVILAVPALTKDAVIATSPDAFDIPFGGATVATAVLLEPIVTARPGTGLLDASRSRTVPGMEPAPITESVGNETMRDDTAGTTFTLSVPVFPSTFAEIIALPGETAVITPVEGFTVATPLALVLQLTGRPVSTLLLASRRVAVAWSVPEAMIESAGALTVTVLTAARILTTRGALVFPSLDAVMLVVPVPTAVINPVAFTVATPVALLAHVVGLPVSTALPASRSVTVA